MSEFEPAVVAAVTGHMNGDHPEDNLLIVRAFGHPDATASTMIGVDGDAGIWRVTDARGEHEVRVAWPGAPITERPEIRREVVALYQAACERLGIAPREEHEESAPAAGGAAHGTGHPHGAGSPHGSGHPHGGAADGAEDTSFSKAIREATWGDHSDAEGAGFMDDIMRERASFEDYAALAAQHYYVYVALEEASKLLTAEAGYTAFHNDALVRIPKLETDLERLYGADWRDKISPVAATDAYVSRIRELQSEGWLPGIVAHHYTRYLGDLSGGQMIARIVARQHGFDGAGVAFYDFTELGAIAEFKNAYRDALNALGERLSEEERTRMLEEVRLAYRFNSDTFKDLAQARTTM